MSGSRAKKIRKFVANIKAKNPLSLKGINLYRLIKKAQHNIIYANKLV